MLERSHREVKRVQHDEKIDAIISATNFKGGILIADAETVLAEHRAAPENAIWPWASVTKQVVATLVMQQVADGKIALDAPVTRYLATGWSDDSGPVPTVKQLLQHQSGLRNPEDSAPDAIGFPSFYSTGESGLGWCLTNRNWPATEGWRYNNCDYIALGAMLEEVTNTPLPVLFWEKIARPAGMSRSTGFLTGDPNLNFFDITEEYRRSLPRYGSAGAMAGPMGDLLAFDRALLDGRLLPAKARDIMWRGEPALGYMGLGQWSFSAPLAGCTDPVRIIERRGGIGKYQVRNILLPDSGRTIIVFTYDGDFNFGEIWQGKGFSYDLLSTAAQCGTAAP